MYATLNCQLRKSSCYKCWRVVSRVWKCIWYAALWKEECSSLVKDSTEESRKKSAALFSFLLSSFFYSSFFCFPPLFSLYFFVLPRFILHIFMPSVAKAWLVLSTFSHHLLVLSLPFLFLLHFVSSHHFLLVSPTRVCGDWCRASLEVSTVAAAAPVFTACGRDLLIGFFSHLFYNLHLYLFEHNITLLLFCSSYRC